MSHTWHDHMCQGHTLIAIVIKKQLLITSYIYNRNVMQLSHATKVQLVQKSTWLTTTIYMVHSIHHINVYLVINFQLQYNSLILQHVIFFINSSYFHGIVVLQLYISCFKALVVGQCGYSRHNFSSEMLMLLTTTLIIETKNLVHVSLQNLTRLLFSMELEEEKFLTFEKKATTPNFHFLFLLYVASFFNLPFWIVILKGWRMNLKRLQMGDMSYVFGKPSSRAFPKHMTHPLCMAIEKYFIIILHTPIMR